MIARILRRVKKFVIRLLIAIHLIAAPVVASENVSEAQQASSIQEQKETHTEPSEAPYVSIRPQRDPEPQKVYRNMPDFIEDIVWEIQSYEKGYYMIARAQGVPEELFEGMWLKYDHELNPYDMLFSRLGWGSSYGVINLAQEHRNDDDSDQNPYQLDYRRRVIWDDHLVGWLDDKDRWILEFDNVITEEEKQAYYASIVELPHPTGKNPYVYSGSIDPSVSLGYGLAGSTTFWSPFNDLRFHRYDLPEGHPFYGMLQEDIMKVTHSFENSFEFDPHHLKEYGIWPGCCSFKKFEALHTRKPIISKRWGDVTRYIKRAGYTERDPADRGEQYF